MSKNLGLRLFKLFVLFGFPMFGLLYAYQYTNQDGAKPKAIPFRSFIPQELSVVKNGDLNNKVQIPLNSAVTVVNFWATWCPPCVEEFPAMVEMRRQLQGKDVKMIFVSVDEKWENVGKFLKVNNIPFDQDSMFWDPEKKTAASWGSTKFPETYVVRRDGWVVERIIGQQAWTRPAVIEYFVKLSEKFKDIQKKDVLSSISSSLGVLPAYAQSAKDEPLIHEQDKKSLEKLKSNIETATENLQKADAAEKEEGRNLQEQRIVLERREKELLEAQSDLDKIEAKSKEMNTLLMKTSDSLKAEEKEKKNVESQIKEIQSKIAELQKRLDQTKDELTQANKGLNTRVQSVETFEKARESAEEEAKGLKEKRETALRLVQDRKKEVGKASKEIFTREAKLSEIRSLLMKTKKELDEQKKKLAEFEQMLKKQG
jgi:thiol-disulfide isomerase/thioredoxin